MTKAYALNRLYIWYFLFVGTNLTLNGPHGEKTCLRGYQSAQLQRIRLLEFTCTVEPVFSGHSKTGKTKVLKTDGSLIQAESIAECSPWSVLQYF